MQRLGSENLGVQGTEENIHGWSITKQMLSVARQQEEGNQGYFYSSWIRAKSLLPVLSEGIRNGARKDHCRKTAAVRGGLSQSLACSYGLCTQAWESSAAK